MDGTGVAGSGTAATESRARRGRPAAPPVGPGAMARRRRYPRAVVDLEPGEVVFFHGHPSWRSMLPFYLRGVLLALFLGALAGIAGAIADGHVQVTWVIGVVLIAFLVLIAIGQVRLMRTAYAITDRRLTIEIGLVSKELHQTRLE